LVALLLFSFIACLIPAQSQALASHELMLISPVAMPSDRVEDSYAVYSQILPVDKFQSWGPEHSQLWLIEDTTSGMEQPMADIRKCLNPPAKDAGGFAQVLSDFDRRKGEHISLQRKFHVERPYLLLDQQDTKDYWATRAPDAAAKHPELVNKFHGAPGIMSVSEVYFNTDKTIAAVWIWGGCGSLCGQGYWVALKKIDSKWVKQKWGSCVAMS
jgi:hypothetical protein